MQIRICVVYKFQCDLCNASYVGFTLRHLHQRMVEHKYQSSSIGKHLLNKHCNVLKDLDNSAWDPLQFCERNFDSCNFPLMIFSPVTFGSSRVMQFSLCADDMAVFEKNHITCASKNQTCS